MHPHRNAPCPCGSGKKYKNCCELKKAEKQENFLTKHIGKFGASVLLLGIVALLISISVSEQQAKKTGRIWSSEHGHWHEVGNIEPDSNEPGPAPPGKVWSAEHGHWHDTPLNPTADRGVKINKKELLTAPEGKVWSEEHGHWHDDF